MSGMNRKVMPSRPVTFRGVVNTSYTLSRVTFRILDSRASRGFSSLIFWTMACDGMMDTQCDGMDTQWPVPMQVQVLVPLAMTHHTKSGSRNLLPVVCVSLMQEK